MKDTEKLHEAILRLDSSVNLLSTSTSRLASAAFHLLDKQREMVAEQAKPMEAMYARQEAQRAHRAQAEEGSYLKPLSAKLMLREDHEKALIHALRTVNEDEIVQFAVDFNSVGWLKLDHFRHVMHPQLRHALDAFLAKRLAS